MSAASRQRERETGRGWNHEQREAYRLERLAKKARVTFKKSEKKAARGIARPNVEAPIDGEDIPLL